MKQKSESALSTATQLLEERRKLEGWLSALHDRRSTTPEHVYTRVRADYEARLEAVASQLLHKADALDQRVAELTAQADTLQADARAVQDERAEAELRAHVGEIDAGEWETTARAADARIETLATERRTVEQELASLRELRDAARSPTPSEPGVAVAASPPRPSDTEPSAGDAFGPTGGPAASEEAAGGDAPLVSESDETPHGPGFDELEFLRNVTGVSGTEPADAPEPPPARDTGDRSVPASGAPAARPPVERPAVERPAVERPAVERPRDDSLGLVLPDGSPAFAPQRRSSTEVPMAANVPGNSPIVIHAEAKQTKTLKCTECSAMNYATEWYCERCGAELSAL